MTFSTTPDQDNIIAARWNQLANAKSQISPEQVYLLWHDNADDEMGRNGCVAIEVRTQESASGAPTVFYVTDEEVCLA